MRQAILLSVAVLCSSCSVLGLSAQPTPAPISKQLIGQWQGNITDNGTRSLVITFAPNGVATMTTLGLQSSLSSAKVRYTIDPNAKPMQMDIKVEPFDQSVLTIFDLPNPQRLRLQLKDTKPGGDRPTAFNQEMQFRKVSDSAIAPFTELAQAEQSKAGEGELVMKTLALSALLHNLETDQFPTTLEQLGLSSNTRNYRLQLSVKDQQLTLIARPKKEGLHSFIGVVMRHDIEKQGKKEELASATVCQSARPSSSAPPMPKITAPAPVTFSTYSIDCSSGSEPVQF